jgi:hypothetical protein
VFGTVALDDVTDFVSKDAGELTFGFELVKEGAGDKDLTAREGEGVDGFGVREEVEFECVRCFFGDGVMREVLTDPLDKIKIGPGGDLTPILGGHVGGGLEAEGNFLISGDVDALGFAGNGIGLA